MYIKNATYKSIPTEGLSFPLAEGTIISGGIVPETTALAPPTGRVYIAIGGTIDLASDANKNVSFTDEQMKSLGADFNFIPAEEVNVKPAPVKMMYIDVVWNDTGDYYEIVNNAGDAVSVDDVIEAINEGNIIYLSLVSLESGYAAFAFGVMFPIVDDGFYEFDAYAFDASNSVMYNVALSTDGIDIEALS